MVSEHFSEEEVIHTDTGLDNEIPEPLKQNATRLAEDVLEPSRILIGPLTVNSWFRCPAVNRAVEGDPNSSHLEARAADVVPNGDVFRAFKMIVASDIPYDKIIFEQRKHKDGSIGKWIHIQVRKDGTARRLASTSDNFSGSMKYTAFHA